ncbi:MAG: uracil-DNA glycosylase [bacterium]|nr:uracil-DNA glycosylase [bacterium]
MEDKQAKLDQIRAEIIKNNVCPDLAKTAKNIVMGEGNPDAEVIFVGEAPGKKEDELGIPFIGAAGKFLNEMLASINLDRSDVFITSIVKYRPPNNRDPLPEEKAEFLPYLVSQIEVIEPKLVVTLGRHSLNCFMPEHQIGKVHGELKYHQGQAFLPLYHPAAALYNGSLRQILISDFARIPDILKKIK